MTAPTCSSFNSLQKFCKWGLLLYPILCHTLCSAYSPGMLIFQQLLYASQEHNLMFYTINLSVLCMPVKLIARISPMAILSLCQRFVVFFETFLLKGLHTLKVVSRVQGFSTKPFYPLGQRNLKGHVKVPFYHSIPCVLLHCILNDWPGAWTVLQDTAGSMRPVFCSESQEALPLLTPQMSSHMLVLLLLQCFIQKEAPSDCSAAGLCQC